MLIPVLHIEGRNIVDDKGKIVRLPGFAAFSLLKRALVECEGGGWNVLAKPNLEEYRAIATEAGYPADAPLVVRVFRHAGGTNSFAMDPWSYTMAQVRDFAQKCADLGFIIDWVGGDYHLCFEGLDGPRGVHEHHNQFTAALVGITSIWCVTNEPFKNGLNPGDSVPPPWAPVIQYTGNYADDRNTGTDLACVNLHTDRSQENGAEKWAGKGFESAPYLWLFNKPIFYDEGMGADEEYQRGRRSNVPAHFYIQGQELAAVSANYFHCTDGMSGSGFRPVTRQCAVAFMRGAASALSAPSF